MPKPFFFYVQLTKFRQVADTPSLLFALRFEQSLSRTTINGDRRIWFHEKGGSSFTSMWRSNKGYVCCKKTSNPSKSNQEEIISLLRRIQSSISKGESRGIEEKKNSDESSKEKPLTKAILDVLEKPRKKTEGNQRFLIKFQIHVLAIC